MSSRICILVTGSRDWIDRKAIWNRLRTHHPYQNASAPPRVDVLLHGAARGADTLGGDCGLALGFIIEPTPYFEEFGRAGGIRRNALLLDKLLTYGKHGYVMIVEAFVLPTSVGTRDMLRRVEAARGDKTPIAVHETHQERP